MGKIGADAVIAEGMEAGGHIGKLTSCNHLVRQVAEAVSIQLLLPLSESLFDLSICFYTDDPDRVRTTLGEDVACERRSDWIKQTHLKLGEAI